MKYVFLFIYSFCIYGVYQNFTYQEDLFNFLDKK